MSDKSGAREQQAQEKSELQALLDELDRRTATALLMGGEDKLAKRRKQGVLDARERVERLVDKDSFIETGLLGVSWLEQDRESTPGDGKVTGFGKIDGRDVAVSVNDFTVKGSSTSATNSKKVGYVKRTGTERGMPVVFVGESTGARLPDAMGSRGMGALLGNDPTQFRRTRDTPWCAAALGYSFGSSAWLACCSDFTVMRKGSTMAVSSPRLIAMAIKEEVDLDELGGWRLHAEKTGLVDMVVDTDEEALDAIRTFLSYMPSHNREAPPVKPVPAGSGADMKDIYNFLPERRTQVYDVRKIVQCIVDNGSYFELKPRFGKSAVTALCRLDGKSVGIIANNPIHKGGALDVQGCEKITSFQVLCDSFNIPIVTLVDTPGFIIGTEAERNRAPGKIMNFMNSTCLVSVPKLSIILRKSYGRAYVAMGGGRHSDDIAAWPTAEVSFMDPVFATRIVHGKAPGEEGFDEAFRQIQKDTQVWGLAESFTVSNILRPEHTRDYLIRMLDIHRLRMTDGVGQHHMRTWPTSY
ncbi:MAG: carboxyl transferase domain-containing protein [Acetobacterales bacterium]